MNNAPPAIPLTWGCLAMLGKWIFSELEIRTTVRTLAAKPQNETSYALP